MSEPKPYLSPSRLNMLARCAIQYRFRYEDGIVAPPGVAMVIGTGTHKAVEADLRHKIRTGGLLSAEEVEAEAADALETAWELGDPRLTEEEEAIGARAMKGRAKDTAVYLAGVHHRLAAPKIQPVAVERKFRLEVEGSAFDLLGIIDVQEAGAVRDTKTTGRLPAKDAAEKSIQLTMYAMAVGAFLGSTGQLGSSEVSTSGSAAEDPRPLREVPYAPTSPGLDTNTPIAVHLDFLYRGNGEPYIVRSSTRGPEDFGALLQRVEAAARVIEAGAYFPTSPDNWACSPRFCGWWARCPWGARRRVQG